MDNRQNDQSNVINSLNVNGVVVTEKRKIADSQNLYFDTLGKELGKKFSTCNNANCLK